MPQASKKKTYTYAYPRPSVTADTVVITRERVPRVLLVRRKRDPYAGMWALPGGFVEMDETLEESARRELMEETGVAADAFEQLYTFGDPGRDPRGRTVSVVYLVRVHAADVKPKAGDDAGEVAWYPLNDVPVLAFDHRQILSCARKKIRK